MAETDTERPNLVDIWAAVDFERPMKITKPDNYVARYEEFFRPLRDKEITIVEVGVYKGYFLRALSEYFPKAQIIGIDLKLPENWQPLDRVTLFKADQSDAARLHEIFKAAAPGGADIIIDDASHLGAPSKALFDATFVQHLKHGGLYFIEDWGVGYRESWPDGATCNGQATSEDERRIPSHDYGMVGFVKSLVDELRQGHNTSITNLHFAPGIVTVTKR